jgi:hypothetical protein
MNNNRQQQKPKTKENLIDEIKAGVPKACARFQSLTPEERIELLTDARKYVSEMSCEKSRRFCYSFLVWLENSVEVKNV